MRAAITRQAPSRWPSDRACASDLSSDRSASGRRGARGASFRGIGVRNGGPRTAGYRRHVAHARQPSVLLQAAQLAERRRRQSCAAAGERNANVERPKCGQLLPLRRRLRGCRLVPVRGLISQIPGLDAARALRRRLRRDHGAGQQAPAATSPRVRVIAMSSSNRRPRRRTSERCPGHRQGSCRWSSGRRFFRSRARAGACQH